MMDLARFKEAAQKLAATGKNDLSGLNLACWLGERAHLLIAEVEALRGQRDALRAASKDFLDLWPLGGYELEAYCDATLVPALSAAVAKAQPPKGA